VGFKAKHEWEMLKRNLEPLLTSEMDLIELAPGNHRRSMVRRLAQPIVRKYSFADLNNRHADKPGFVRMDSEYECAAEDGEFDVTVCFQAAHNISRFWRFMEEMARITKPGGFVFVMDSANEDLNLHPKDHARWFVDGMELMMQDSGLTVEVCKFERADGVELPRGGPIGRNSQGLPVHVIAVGRA